jgi:hypothetical protein
MKETAPAKKAPGITPSAGSLQLQRCACGGSAGPAGECAECRNKRLGLQRKEMGAGPAVAPPIVHEVLRSPGRPLEPEVRSSMESRFGHDFGRVRVHADSRAAESARSVNALAYTVGNHIAFSAGQYAPSTGEGRRLLVHELVHTMQQAAGEPPVGGTLPIGPTTDLWEHEAKAAADGGMAVYTPSRPVVRRQEISLEAVSPEEAEALRRRGINLPRVSPETAANPPSLRIEEVTPEEEQALRARGIQLPGTVPDRPGRILNGGAWGRCGRRRSATLRVSGYNGRTTGTYIDVLRVTINPNAASEVALSWRNANLSPGATLPTSFRTSPGAGNCDRDCSDPAQSQRSGSHCTEIGPFVVQGHECHLPSDQRARFVTWFNYAREIAFHYYPDVPNYPASHGCARLPQEPRAAEWIYDNVLPGITRVSVTRDSTAGPGPKCWRGRSLIDRPAPASPVRR